MSHHPIVPLEEEKRVVPILISYLTFFAQNFSQPSSGGSHECVSFRHSSDSGCPKEHVELVGADVEERTLSGAQETEERAKRLAPVVYQTRRNAGIQSDVDGRGAGRRDNGSFAIAREETKPRQPRILPKETTLVELGIGRRVQSAPFLRVPGVDASHKSSNA